MEQHTDGVDAPREETPPPGILLRLIKDERIAFLLVGGFNTVIGTAWFALFFLLWGHAIPYPVVLVIAWAVQLPISFTLHRKLVFKVSGNLVPDFTRYTVVNLVPLFANMVLLPLVVETTPLQPIVAQILVTIVITVATYTGHKFFSFRRPRDEAVR
ncbi:MULTISPECIES: GtrA family protein [Clavibacter]|uniref:GtrA family protein n=1 Tax=Clavibacter TaxID=1573 RepID=UPI001BDF9731|nr:GtrA family protein [Clavibacter michiganensis]MBT1635498.1 GtrA family protein [Clavibacter michiganensis]